VKRRIVHGLQKYLLNPPVRLLLGLGLVPPTYALLETRGRKSGKPRRTPVGNGLDNGTFWIVAEHGRKAGYVRNLQHDPRVRIKIRNGLRYQWRDGTAHALPDDDPRERQKELGTGHPGRWLNALVVRTVGTDLMTIRIDLD
jgi:deazaflavin-dependent oxidoreductase (nitroreductase family)